jgi:outer membrane protein assembly factor BamA
MSPRRALALGVVGLGCLAASPAPGAAQQIRGPEVLSVEFLGNASFPRDSLQRAIATSQTECRSFWLQWVLPVCPFFGWGQRRAELRDRDVTLDVQRLIRWYQLRGFREVHVESSTDVRVAGAEGGDRVIWTSSGRPPRHEPIPEDAAEVATVRFTIDEGRPIIADSIGYATPDGFALGDLLQDLPIRPGDRWSTLELDATRDTLTSSARRGYRATSPITPT